MTPEEELIQELRGKIRRLEERNAELEKQHQADISMLVYFRRQVDFLMDAAREAEYDKRQR